MTEPERTHGVHDGLDRPQARRSTRWAATPTTFGPVVKVLLSLPSLRVIGGAVGAMVVLGRAVVALSLPWAPAQAPSPRW